MNILLLGSGGREHALAWALRRSRAVKALYAMPGSDALAAQSLAVCLAGDPCAPAAVLAAAAAHDADLTVVGPEAPLAAGVADALRAAGRTVFGPSRDAARLESSKIFAKQFMQRYRIPTARFAEADSFDAAVRALSGFDFPVVIKADGLAAGKGVVIAPDRSSAESTLEGMLGGELVGAAGRRVVLEDFLSGPEISLLALADGARALPLTPARDHKRVFDGDRGPNTGGMGAISAGELLPPAVLAEIDARILRPVMAGMEAEACPFQGVLYCGLMLTAAGPRVLEFNVRFGDPETQAILPRLESDLASALFDAARGRAPAPLAWSPDPAACIIAAAAGYPAAYATGRVIAGLGADGQIPGRGDALVFHAGTRRQEAAWITTGGRVLGISARHRRLDGALEAAYGALAAVRFEGMQFRSDIGRAVRADSV